MPPRAGHLGKKVRNKLRPFSVVACGLIESGREDAVSTWSIDSDHLDIMQQAMDLACSELAIAETDTFSRERIAFLVTGFMRAGEHDPRKLTIYVVDQFKLPI
ncbi:MAG: hypothetical protein JSS54_10630 [Proteobacteria bacterium]|nr:hypothetical protein [Pseudomonadota bacterium]